MKQCLLIFFISSLVFAKESLREDRVLNRWEFRTAPLALLAKWYTVDISYRFSDSFSTGPAVVFYGASEDGNMFLPSYNGNALGWQANYYIPSSARYTWYGSGRIYFEDYKSYPHAKLDFNENKGHRLSSTVGVRMKNAGVVTLIGAGVEYGSHEVTEKNDLGETIELATESKFLPVIEFKMGFEI